MASCQTIWFPISRLRSKRTNLCRASSLLAPVRTTRTSAEFLKIFPLVLTSPGTKGNISTPPSPYNLQRIMSRFQARPKEWEYSKEFSWCPQAVTWQIVSDPLEQVLVVLQGRDNDRPRGPGAHQPLAWVLDNSAVTEFTSPTTRCTDFLKEDKNILNIFLKDVKHNLNII